MTKELPICSLSVDLDNQWSYMKTHGDAGWETFPSYLDLVVPRALEVLDRFGWKITFFIVGQDAALEKNREALQAIAAAGHEIGNHSFTHEPWLHLYTKQQTADEITRAEEAIEAATGHRPRGFRGPGYSFSRATLEVLSERDYLYDASTLPTYLGPIARAYYFRSARHLTPAQRRERELLYGRISDGIRPVAPYFWAIPGATLLEIPVTTIPFFKLPFHFSYLLYIATHSPALALFYFRSALGLCRIAGIQPSLLLHPLDFLGAEEGRALGFFPAMAMALERKRTLMVRALALLASRHRIVQLAEHAGVLFRGPALPSRPPPNGDLPRRGGGRSGLAR